MLASAPVPVNISERLAQALQGAQQAAVRHPRRVGAVVLAVTAGLSASAFGIASVAPDAADLPVAQVAVPLVVQDLPAQLEALAGHRLTLTRSDLTRAGDTADSLLRRLGASDPSAAAFLRTDPTARRLIEGRPGKPVQALVDDDGRLTELVARYPVEADNGPPERFHRLTVRAVNGTWQVSAEQADLQPQLRMASGSIRSSLFAATDDAGIPDAVAVQVAEIFSSEIDFHRELRKGDTFSVVYEALTADGEPLAWGAGVGRVVAAEFVNAGRTHQALWFEGGNGRGGYFDAQGNSLKRAFLASPMAFSRITSGFAMRFHPILQRWRAHKGVDYAAPVGTPVRTVGDGVVAFSGWQNGFGNVVIVEHSKDRETVYAHLSRIDVKRGERVEQGERIGAVGATGWATGPHLHFEFRVNGEHRDPLILARQAETMALDATLRPQFTALAERMQVKLDIAQTVAVTRSGVQ